MPLPLRRQASRRPDARRLCTRNHQILMSEPASGCPGAQARISRFGEEVRGTEVASVFDLSTNRVRPPRGSDRNEPALPRHKGRVTGTATTSTTDTRQAQLTECDPAGGMGLVVIWIVHLVLLLCGSHGLEYDGQACENVVNFELEDGTDISSIDAGVEFYMHTHLPMWLAQTCTTQVRRWRCMSEYIEHAVEEDAVCQSVCEDFYSVCGDDWRRLLGEYDYLPLTADQLFQLMQVPLTCDPLPTSNCSTGGLDYGLFPQDVAICPNPFVYTAPGLDRSDVMVKELPTLTDCNVECPNLMWSDEDFGTVQDLVTYTATIALVGSLITLIAQAWETPEQLCALLFVIGCFGSSVGMCLLVYTGYEDNLCENEYKPIQFGSICLAQAYISFFFFLFMSTAVLCQAWDLYARIVLNMKRNKLARFLPIYAAVTFLVPTACVVLVLALPERLMGFDRRAGLAWCFFRRRSESELYSWFLFFAPQCLCVVACVILIIYTAYSTIKSVMCRSGPSRRGGGCCRPGRDPGEPDQVDDMSDTRSSLGAFWLRFWRYNFQPILFVILYCALTVVHMVFYLQSDVDEEEIEENEVEYHVCILLAAMRTTDMDAGIKACGDNSANTLPLYNFAYKGFYFGSVGIFAILIYGSNVAKRLKQFWRERVVCSSSGQHPDKFRFHAASSIPMHHGSQAAVYTTHEPALKGEGADANEIEMARLSSAGIMQEELVPSVREAVRSSGRGRPQQPIDGSKPASYASSSDMSPIDRHQLELAAGGSDYATMRSLHRDVSDPKSTSEAGYSITSRKSLNSVERGFVPWTLPLEQEFPVGASIIVNNRKIATVNSVLGEGAFGRVYHVVLSLIHPQVESKSDEGEQGPARAMKVSRFDSTATSYTKNLAQLCDEAVTALHIGTHPNLVALRYMCKDESARATQDSYLLFYDFIDGVNLHTALTTECFLWMQNDAKVGAREMELRLFSLAYQLLRALEYIHDRNVLHQDIKPQNIMVGSDGRLRVTDFGLAYRSSGTSSDGAPVGFLKGYSRTYYSPEIAKHVHNLKSTIKIGDTKPLEIEPRTSDLWAAALTILQMYCGGNVRWQQGHGENGQKAFDAYRDDIRTFEGSPYDWSCEKLTEYLSEGLWNEAVITTITDLKIPASQFCWMSEQDMTKTFTFAGNRSGALRKISALASSFRVFEMPYGLVRAITASLSSKTRERPASARELLETTLGCLMFKHTNRSKRGDSPTPTPTPDDQTNNGLGDADDAQPQPSLQDVVAIMSNVAHTAIPDEEAARSYYNLGLAIQKCGQPAASLRCFQKAVTFNSPPAMAFYSLGIALLFQGDTEEAIQALRRSVELAPDDPKARYNYAMALYKQEDFEGCRAELLRAVEIQPGYTFAHYGFFRLHRQELRVHEGWKALRKCVQLDSKRRLPKAWLKLGQMQRLIKGSRSAVQVYKRAVREVPCCRAGAFAYLALEAYMSDRLGDAIRLANSCLSLVRGEQTADIVGGAGADEEQEEETSDFLGSEKMSGALYESQGNAGINTFGTHFSVESDLEQQSISKKNFEIISLYVLYLTDDDVQKSHQYRVTCEATNAYCHQMMGDIFWAYGDPQEAEASYARAKVGRTEELEYRAAHLTIAASAPTPEEVVEWVAQASYPTLIW